MCVFQDREPERAALAREGDGLPAERRRERRVQVNGGVGVDQAHAVGSDQPHTGGPDLVAQGLLAASAAFACLRESGADEDDRRDVRRDAVVQHAVNPVSRDRDDRQIDGALDVADGSIGTNGFDRCRARVDRYRRAAKPTGNQIVNVLGADAARLRPAPITATFLGSKNGRRDSPCAVHLALRSR